MVDKVKHNIFAGHLNVSLSVIHTLYSDTGEGPATQSGNMNEINDGPQEMSMVTTGDFGL